MVRPMWFVALLMGAAVWIAAIVMAIAIARVAKADWMRADLFIVALACVVLAGSLSVLAVLIYRERRQAFCERRVRREFARAARGVSSGQPAQG